MQFEAFPKIPRLKRAMVVTEKIDGTNAQVFIREDNDGEEGDEFLISIVGSLALYAGSRNRYITPENDNFGFARWVLEHSEELVVGLGPGRHYGEWWGQGVQRGYDLDHRRFSLFNAARWGDHNPPPACCHVVPILHRGSFDEDAISSSLERLRATGSHAAPGYMNPEGVVVYLSAANSMFKILLENDELPKSAVAAKESVAATTISD